MPTVHPGAPHRRLGKAPPKHDKRTLLLANYLVPQALPHPPPALSWTDRVSSWPVMLNDQLGDCVIAGAGHHIQCWSANASGHVIVLPDSVILAGYEAVGGYDPKRPETDQGALLLDACNYWRRVGFAGHKITAFAALEPKNSLHLKQAIMLFGGVYVGLALPESAQTQRVWSVPPQGPTGSGAPGSWGGHCVCVLAYDSHGLICVTWGQLMRMTWGFWRAYCDEAFGLIAPEWIGANGKAPSGFDLPALLADLKQVTA